MKHSIVLKFIAVALCAAFLLAAVGSGVGALALSEMGLYEQTVDDLYDESRNSLAEAFAGQIAINYASQTLGGCPEAMTENYHIFNAGYYGYTLRDAEGNVLAEEELETPAEGTKEYTFTVQESYMKLLEVIPDSQRYAETEPDEDGYLVYDAVPPEGADVQEISVDYLNGHSESFGTNGTMGYLSYRDDGSLMFTGLDGDFFLSVEGPVTHISFVGTNGELLYEASAEEGGIVGEIFHSASGVQFQSWLNTLQNDQAAIAEPPATTAPTEEPTQYPFAVLAYNLVNNIPAEGAIVDRMDYIAGGGLQGFTIGEQTGFLSYNADGAVIFHTTDPSPVKPDGDTFYYVAFYDVEGNLLYESSNPEGVGTFYLDGENFLHFTSTMETADAPTETIPPTTEETSVPTAEATTPVEPTITDNIAKQGSKVSTILMVDAEGDPYTIDPGVPQGKAFAYLFRNDDGTITCRSYEAMTLVAVPDTITCISFLDADGYLLYKVQSSESVGSFILEGDTNMRFVTSVIPNPVVPVTEPYTEPTTVPDTTTATEVVQTPVDVPQETSIIAELTDPTEATMPPVEMPEDYTSTYYYDHELGEHVHANYVYEEMPEAYTVELILAPGAYEMDAVYDLLVWVWGYRNQLLYLLGISLLGFAITAVYLCCAAGKKKGREEIRAGGFNCLSLDVYLGVGVLAVSVLVIMGVEGGYYLLRYSPQILAPFVVIMGYAAALIIVGFCFACAAQFKTPGGYWWRNTLTIRCAKLAVRFLRWSVKLFIRFMGWLERFLGKAFPWMGKAIQFCWKTFLRLCVATYHCTEQGLTWLGRGLGKIAQRTYAWLNAFLSLLPVTWQWLLIGLFLLFILFLSILTRSEGFIIFGCLAGIALVVYGSHCFGLLLDSTKRMSKGDLETKVDDKLMVGSFKEFAGDLNSLADVAVVAAQKQMASERMKTELITNVSHDIKTPLTSIINYVDLLQKPHTDEEQEAYLEVLSRQSQRMKKLLEDLIEMSKASTGNMTVNITRINAVEAVNQALGEFADKLEKAHLTTMVQHPEEAVYMQADGRLAWRVLSNILSNAVKYALPGTRVYIDVMEMDGKVLISLKNISREALNVSAEELMERFVRGDTSRNTEGSGLGLNIAQSLMEIQKGKLQLTVDGDLFKVTLIFPSAEE